MTSRFEQELGDELYAAAVREQQRRRRSVRAMVAAAAAVVAGGVAIAWPNPAAADVEVRIEDGTLHVRIADDDVTPDEVLEAIEDEGLEASVVGLTTGPSGVGSFVRATVPGGGAQPAVSDEVGAAFRSFSLPAGWTGDLVIGVGIAAEGDEVYDALSDPFGPGEPLRCQGVLGRPLRDVADRLADLSVSVRAFEGDLLVAEATLMDALASEHADWIVESGIAVSAIDITLDVVPEADVDETGC